MTSSTSVLLKLLLSCLLGLLALSAADCACWAAFEGMYIDSRSAAMGDCWSASDCGFHFLAPVPPPVTRLTTSACYSAPYGLSELAQENVLLNVPRCENMFTLGITERGGALCKERILAACVSRRPFPSTRIMLSLGALSMSVDGLGEARFFTAGAGLRSQPFRFLETCVGLGNLGSSSASASRRGAVPSTFLFGLLLKPSENVTVAGEVREIPGEKSSLHLGAELAPQGGIRLRCGLQTEPVELAVGFAIEVGRLSIESASSFHSVLGRTDVITIAFGSRERTPPAREVEEVPGKEGAR